MEAVVAKILIIAIGVGVAMNYDSIKKEVKKCSMSDVINFFRFIFIKLPIAVIVVAIIIGIIAIPFIYTGPVGGMIIWTCIIIILGMLK